ncbi:hypothetical protein BJ912DRAFT_969248 [Pholiota molesta]|nr:hypothetical protein BJ912DRAFT_969248 [Pholiota molesta]
MSPASLSTIPLELFPQIASHIPLRFAPGTLHSLALVNRYFYDIVSPLLYSRLILRNEDDAIAVIRKILKDPKLGLAVTELHIMSELSIATRGGQKPFDVLVGLQALLREGLIPRLVALGIYLLQGWCDDEDPDVSRLHGHLSPEFWNNLRSKCPRLHTLAVRNIAHDFDDPLVSGATIDGLKSFSNLVSLRVEMTGDEEYLADDDNIEIFNNLPRLASSLHTLSLESEHQDANLVLCYDFPNLQWLRLQEFDSKNETSKIMAFFKRHPQLAGLSLVNCVNNWFSDDVKEGFLPNLKHLKARFVDIRTLVPILPQLISLAFVQSHNAQVPYLLRAVLPNGLPQLKSLEIYEFPVNWDDRHSMEGVQWYETSDGKFHVEQKRKTMLKEVDFPLKGYMHSIVKGAPNLEELALYGMTPLDAEKLNALAPTLSQLVGMERFYYNGISPDIMYMYPHDPYPDFDEELEDFLSGAGMLAQACARLTTISSFGSKYLPYISAKIERDSEGEVLEVTRSDGVGMLISADENDPFPRNP